MKKSTTTDPRALYAEELPDFGPNARLYTDPEVGPILDGLLGDSPALGGESEVTSRLQSLR